MSTNARWVTVHLQTYCGPGAHDYRETGPAGEVWCLRCYKEEVLGRTCAICDSNGNRMVTVRHPTKGLTTAARLCDPCYEGLRESRDCGWELAEAGARQQSQN